MTIPAYPLQWPQGWKRTAARDRVRARFGAATETRHTWSDGNSSVWRGKRGLTVADGVARIRNVLAKMTHSDDCVISTNLTLRLDGLPRSNQRDPDDPGVALYWREVATDAPRCMAIDRYDRVADNLAAIAATLEAMRAIERHGGAEILSRAFTGFVAIGHEGAEWNVVLGVPAHASTDAVRHAYLRARAACHPDRGGNARMFSAVQQAWTNFCTRRGIYE